MSSPHIETVAELDREFGRILEESLNEIFILDARSLRFIQVNRGARENLGYSMPELCQMTPLDIIPQFTPETFAELLIPLRQGRARTVSLETVHCRKDGSCYDVESHLQLSTYHGTPVFVVFVLDTTRREHANKLLGEREAHLQAVLTTAVEAIITIDERGICETVNPAAVRMFGYSADELIGQNVSLLMPSPDREEHDNYLANYLSTGEKKIIGIGRETIGQRKDGTQFPIHLSVSEIRLNDRRLFTGMIQDITDRKEAERRLVQSERLAAVGEALTGLAHESRNLLQKIQMAVELGQLAAQGNEAVVQHLANIERASDGLQALLEEVRNYAAPIKLELTQTSVPEVWREAWASLRAEYANRQVVLQEQLDGTSHECPLDRFRMVQVFRNLFENSLAACTDPVEIVIRVTESHTANGTFLHVVVCDNGPGLDLEQTQRIFEPFFTTKSKGTGLGMAIAQRILEAHGGRIAVVERPRPGAEFRLELPK